MRGRMPSWFFAMVAGAGAVSLRRTFGAANGGWGLVLGLVAPVMCGVAGIAAFVAGMTAHRRRLEDRRDEP